MAKRPGTITLLVPASMAREIVGARAGGGAAAAIAKVLDESGATRPSAGAPVEDPSGSVYIPITIPDAAAAPALAEKLMRMPGVEAAFIKPEEELP